MTPMSPDSVLVQVEDSSDHGRKYLLLESSRITDEAARSVNKLSRVRIVTEYSFVFEEMLELIDCEY
jgi:hypothetical protein